MQNPLKQLQRTPDHCENRHKKLRAITGRHKRLRLTRDYELSRPQKRRRGAIWSVLIRVGSREKLPRSSAVERARARISWWCASSAITITLSETSSMKTCQLRVLGARAKVKNLALSKRSTRDSFFEISISRATAARCARACAYVCVRVCARGSKGVFTRRFLKGR